MGKGGDGKNFIFLKDRTRILLECKYLFKKNTMVDMFGRKMRSQKQIQLEPEQSKEKNFFVLELNKIILEETQKFSICYYQIESSKNLDGKDLP